MTDVFIQSSPSNTVWYHGSVETKKSIQRNVYAREKQIHKCRKQTRDHLREGAGGAREGLGLRGAATVRGAEKRQRRTAQARQWQPLSSRNVQWSPIHKNVRSVQHTPDTNVMQ